jgi:hypothetical protein
MNKRFDAIAMNRVGRVAQLKLLQKKKIEEPPISMHMQVLLPITEKQDVFCFPLLFVAVF